MTNKYKSTKDQNITDYEAEVLSFWKENRIFEKSVEQRSGDNLYVFYDGPPFISGLPHYGHLLGSIAKDVIPRYWTMKGKRVERVWGWDAHGLTVENKVQKELDIPNRRDIEKFGLDKFTEACYEYTSRISSEWQWYIDRIGRWVDMDNAYKTIDRSYMESVMWAFKDLYDKGLIYEGTRTSLYCTTCGTPVSNFEIAMDNSYKEVEDPAVTVKFKVTAENKFKDAYLLAWTTTPWTLPSNRALVVNENEQYSLVESDTSKYIVGSQRVEYVFSDREHKVIEGFSGKELLGLTYEPIYTFYSYKDTEFQVYSYNDMVTMEEGTGIVHSAPGFGEVDTEMGNHYGLTLMLTIDDEGKFVPGNNGDNPFAGMFYKKADKYIMEDLQNRGFLFKNERILHRFPYHDRCNTLLIQRAQKSWFLRVSELKPQLYANNEEINWIPEYLKHGRFKNGIEQAPDWCVSRTRFWATPMPVWESDDGDRIVVSSVKEIEELSGQKVKDLHRPYIDEIVIKQNGKEYRRRPEVLDSWFEAGSMPFAQIHYPFENEDKFKKNYPGDYIVEYIGQVRAWFYVMHVLSTALFGSAAFKNVISTGVISGNDGRKMSKTYGNYTDPKDILENIGGDALRLYLMNSPLMVGNNASFDDNELRNKSKNVLNPLWNSAKFFIIYANLNEWDHTNTTKSKNVLDQWILSRVNEVLKEFSENIEKYNVPKAVEPIESFVDDLSNWYVRRSRDRINTGNPEALSTLYEVLMTFAKASAPIMPFMSETIYQHLRSENDLESVHLHMYPEYNQELISLGQPLMDQMLLARKICSIGSSIRKERNVPVRQPLMDLMVSDNALNRLSPEVVEIVKEELNVRNVTSFDESLLNDKWVTRTENELTVSLSLEVNEELEIEGNMREMIREIQKLRKESGVEWNVLVQVQYPNELKFVRAVEKYLEEIKKKTYASELKPADSFKLF